MIRERSAGDKDWHPPSPLFSGHIAQPESEGDHILSELQQNALSSAIVDPAMTAGASLPQVVPYPDFKNWRNAAIGMSGSLWGLGAAAIWSGWWTVTRVGVVDDLAAADLAALRFGISGALLLPLAWRKRQAFRAVSPRLLLFMTAGAGAPYVLIAATGVQLTSAGLGGAITVGLLPAFTLVLSLLFLRERVTRRLTAGISCILLGAALVAAGTSAAGPIGYGLGLFVIGALMWAGYTVALRRSRLPPLTATAVVCVASLTLYLPAWAAWSDPVRLLAIAPGELLLQILYQSLLSAIGALYCYGRAVERLGATRASVFAAIVPLFSVIIAAGVLDESPSLLELGGAALLAAGALIASRHVPSRR
jgi:drug/metabolite transporter (DMT)-like permease